MHCRVQTSGRGKLLRPPSTQFLEDAEGNTAVQKERSTVVCA